MRLESYPRTIGPINLRKKSAGKRSAGKSHAAFDVAGTGNVVTVELGTHSATERAEMEILHLKPTRQFSTLPCTYFPGPEQTDGTLGSSMFRHHQERLGGRLSAGFYGVGKVSAMYGKQQDSLFEEHPFWGVGANLLLLDAQIFYEPEDGKQKYHSFMIGLTLDL